MARKITKEKNGGKEFLQTLKELAYEKGIDEELLFETIEAALISAYKRNFSSEQNVRISLSRETGEFHVFAIKEVVEEVKSDIKEISLAQARAISPDYAVGDVVEIEMTPANFGRIAAQTAKQVVMQRLREAERGIVYKEYENRSSDIVTGIVQRVEGRNVFVDIGRAEAVLMATEQMPTEEYNYGDTLRAYIIEVKNMMRGPQIILSRTHPGLLKKLFELQVPEIQEGVVEIKSIAREAGSRSKVAVASSEERVDPIGACVGPHYMRVQAVVDELAGEKIDIVKWSDDPATYIANSLNPAKVISVAVNEAEKVSRVIVPDYQLSLAIGKEGQNARLAAKLTGWKIDIKSESQAQELMAEDAAEDSTLDEPLAGEA
ncbi:MAG: transcription termination factor NusA [Centipeda sp. (in: firmicutes)]|uniref:transcription termination factor NusA n=1 Tax=Selenomonas sp. oral taxon 920 TaxID=1884263 RepID=UPI000840FB5B|nr:transcription termination factor NusA [Selenomonas sp. oral taxon 920]AOH47615.1 transcription termination/antitermination protein NusA [Selenomonas sp. oral taxon 920]